LTIDISGNWIYDANNNQAAIQALDAGQSMTDTLTVSAFDGTTHDIVITINGAEDSAVIGGTAVGAVTEDNALVVSDTLMITDVDSNDNPVSFNDVATTPGSNGYGSFEMTGNTWSYTLNNGHAAVQALDVGETLTDTYTFAASDGSTQVVTVTINGSEDAPLISGTTTGAVSEDGVLAASEMLTISDTDSSDNPISFNDVTPTLGINGYGVFEMSGNTWTYTLNNSHAAVQALDVGETLTDLFTFSASDGSTQIVTITIGGAEDAPTLDNAIADQTATEDAAFNFTFAANTFADLDASDTLIYSATLADSSPLPGWLSFDAATRTFSGTPANSDVGPIDIRITADDGSSTVTDTFTLTVLNVNNAPLIGGEDSGAVTEDAGVVGGIISTTGSLTIADVDAGESSFVGSTVKGALGALTIDTDGNWRYSADNGNPEIQALQSGRSITDTLTVTTADGTTHDVVITINGAAEAAPPPPPPVVEPPIVEPPPEAESPPEEETETGGGVDPIVDDVVRAPQDVTPPPVQEEVDLSSYLQQEEAEVDKARAGILPDKPAIRMVEQPMAQAIQQQAIQQQNLSLGDLSLQVSDDEALNEKYELELLARIDSMHSGMDSDAAQSSADDVEVQIVMGSTASLTAGIVSWVLRGGSLLASLMSTVPLLNRFDPLPILKSREEKEDVEEDTDDDDSDTKFKKHQQRVDKLFSAKDNAREQNGYMND
jgi:VCBS repeat-containing protein